MLRGEPVDNSAIKHIANQCCAHFALCRIDFEMEAKSSHETIACQTKLDKSSPHQFAQVFKAAGKKNPNVPLHEEAQKDCNNPKEWLAAAPKEITVQLKKKGVWIKCLNSEAKGNQIIPHT